VTIPTCPSFGIPWIPFKIGVFYYPLIYEIYDKISNAFVLSSKFLCTSGQQKIMKMMGVKALTL